MSAIARFESIELDELTVDHRYQRPLDKERVRKMVEHFDARKLGTLEVSRTNGRTAVFDGQHRMAVLASVGVSEAPCLVHVDLSPQDEAELFVALQMQRKRVRPTERFKAKVFAGDKDARAIMRIVEKAGYKISSEGSNKSPSAISAIVALERIYAKGGAEGLAQTLDLLHIWEGDEKARDGHIIGGLFWLIYEYGDRLDAGARQRLASTSPTVILRRASGGMNVGGGYTAARVVARELRKVAGVRGRPRLH